MSDTWEVEKRGFLSSVRYEELVAQLLSAGQLLESEEQETAYFDSKISLQLRRSAGKVMLIGKAGEAGDETRHQVEVHLASPVDFEEAVKLFDMLGYGSIAVERRREVYQYMGASVVLDRYPIMEYPYLQLYGFELEMITSAERAAQALSELEVLAHLLKLRPVGKDVFRALIGIIQMEKRGDITFDQFMTASAGDLAKLGASVGVNAGPEVQNTFEDIQWDLRQQQSKLEKKAEKRSRQQAVAGRIE